MRGSQSDPTHTYAPVCTCLRLRYARVNAGGRVRVRLREYHAEYHALHHAVKQGFCTVLVRAI